MSGGMRLAHVPSDPLELQSAAPNRIFRRRVVRSTGPLRPSGSPSDRFCASALKPSAAQARLLPKLAVWAPSRVTLQSS
jgi:hypothetical protein